jgi:hypothetical protein
MKCDPTLLEAPATEVIRFGDGPDRIQHIAQERMDTF